MEKNKLIKRIHDLEKASFEMIKYIKDGIGLYKVSPPTLLQKWDQLIDNDINKPCFYEKKYLETMALLKEINPNVYYELLDKRDKK